MVLFIVLSFCRFSPLLSPFPFISNLFPFFHVFSLLFISLFSMAFLSFLMRSLGMMSISTVCTQNCKSSLIPYSVCPSAGLVSHCFLFLFLLILSGGGVWLVQISPVIEREIRLGPFAFGLRLLIVFLFCSFVLII